MAVVRIRRRLSSDPTSSNRHRVKARVGQDRRRHRQDRPEPLADKARDRPVVPPVRELLVPRDSPVDPREGPSRVPREAILAHHRSRPNRTTTGKISPTNPGGIPILKRTSNRIRPTSSARCIPAVGRARVSTAASIPRKVPSPSPSGVRTTGPVRPDPPAAVFLPVDLREHPTSGTPEEPVAPVAQLIQLIATRRTHSSSNRRTRPINRVNSNRGTRCHRRHRVRRCDRHLVVANRLHLRCRPPDRGCQDNRECHRRRSRSSHNRELGQRRKRPEEPDQFQRRLAQNRCNRVVLSRRRAAWHQSGTLCFRRTASSRRRRSCTSAKG